MKKATCYILGLIFSFFFGFADLLINFAISKNSMSIVSFMILSILMIAALIPALIIYFNRVKDSFNESGSMTVVMVILGVILAVIGWILLFNELWNKSWIGTGYPNALDYILGFGVPALTIAGGILLSKRKNGGTENAERS